MTRAMYAHTELDTGSVALDELVRRNVAYTCGYYARLARLHRKRYRRSLYKRMAFEGIGTLKTAAQEHRGVVLVSVHLGDFDAAGAWLAETLGLVPVVTTDTAPSRLRQAFFDRARRSGGVVVRRRAETCLADLAGDLDRGRLVLAMLDRATPGRSIPVRFLGREVDAPLFAWELALATGALLLPGASWRAPDGTHVLWCGNPVDVVDEAHERAVSLQAMADELTTAVRAAPHQFHVPADLSQVSWCTDQSPKSNVASAAVRILSPLRQAR